MDDPFTDCLSPAAGRQKTVADRGQMATGQKPSSEVLLFLIRQIVVFNIYDHGRCQSVYYTAVFIRAISQLHHICRVRHGAAESFQKTAVREVLAGHGNGQFSNSN